MTTLKIKHLKGAITLFALCLIGTASAAPNGNGNEKENKKEVKAMDRDDIEKQPALQWYNVSYNSTTGQHDIGSLTSAPLPSDACNTDNEGPMCKVAFQQGFTPPSTVESANPSDIRGEANEEAP